MGKHEVIDKAKNIRGKLVELFETIPDTRWDEVFYGKWSLKDLIAHIIGWDIENAKSVKEIISGKVPSCFAYWDENWVTYNDVLVGLYKKGGKSDLLAKMRESYEEYTRVLSDVPDELFEKDTGLRWHEFSMTPKLNVEYEFQDEESLIRDVSIQFIKK